MSSVERAPSRPVRSRRFANSRKGDRVIPLSSCSSRTAVTSSPFVLLVKNKREPNITNSLIRYFFIVCQINEHNKCLLSSNYSSEKMYKEKRMERAEGTTTIAILLGTTSRDGAYIKVIVIRQTEYKDLPAKSPVIHVTDSLYYRTAILYRKKYDSVFYWRRL